MNQVAYRIPSWSNKTFRARKTYHCEDCAGVIPIGVKYMRHVERLGPRKWIDPLRNVHVHLDCESPWYQPEETHRLRKLGSMRKKPKPVYGPVEPGYHVEPSLALNSHTIGSLVWQPPSHFTARLVPNPKQPESFGVMVEMESALTIVMTAFMQASSSKSKALKLNSLIQEIALLLDPVKVQKNAD